MMLKELWFFFTFFLAALSPEVCYGDGHCSDDDHILLLICCFVSKLHVICSYFFVFPQKLLSSPEIAQPVKGISEEVSDFKRQPFLLFCTQISWVQLSKSEACLPGWSSPSSPGFGRSPTAFLQLFSLWPRLALESAVGWAELNVLRGSPFNPLVFFLPRRNIWTVC